MPTLITVDDIEEFSLARRVPRAAISDAVLAGIKQLDERIQIEPFLRSIISDTTETPHGSTETADIFTPHIHFGGRATLRLSDVRTELGETLPPDVRIDEYAKWAGVVAGQIGPFDGGDRFAATVSETARRSARFWTAGCRSWAGTWSSSASTAS